MRRRPSSSGEDEDAGQPAPTSVTSNKTDGMTTGKGAGRVTRQSLRVQERKTQAGKEVNGSPMKDNASTVASSPFARSSLSVEPLEKDSLSQGVPTKQTPDPIADHIRRQAARLRSPWRCSLLTLATSLSAIVMLLTIVHSFVHMQQDSKGCAMSYMRPNFERFSDFDTEHTRFASKYSLYLYREGGIDEDTKVKGIPALFIPGNAGSYKQIRPIAAEAANYFHEELRSDAAAVDGGKRPLDFFTVDFNEELIAFHGQTLLDQAEYLNEAVAYILALYHNPQRSSREPGLPDPKSVIILGHSMGGVVARTMLRTPNYQKDTINTIITLSAPHARPPVSFDAAMVSTYDDINTFWRNSFSEQNSDNNPLDDVTLVSVAGGGLDTMIPSEYTSLTSLVPDTHGFTVFTSSIPRVWTGMDHLAIMWCDQLRQALVRAIFDVLDVRRPSQTRPQLERVRAMRKRLLTGMEPVVEKALLNEEPTTYLTLEHSSTAIMSHGERLVLRTLGDTGATKAHVMPVPSQPFVDGSKFTLLTDQTLDAGEENGTLSVLLCSVFPPPAGFAILSYTINLDPTGNSPGSTRLACKNAAQDVSLLPASTDHSTDASDRVPPFSYLQYALSDIADYQFIAILEKAKDRSSGWAFAEFSTAAHSSIKVSKGHHQLLMHGMRKTLPTDRPLMNEIKIPEVHSTLFAYRFEVDRRPCKEYKESFAPLLRQYIAEPYESKYFVNTRQGNINVHGLSPYMPPPLRGVATDGLSLQLWADPTCNSTVQVSLQVDVLGSAGKLVMRYRTVFASFPLLVIALVLRKQFNVYDTTGVFMSFSQSMDQCIRTSLPAIFMALTFFAVAVSKSSHNVWTREWLSSTTGTSEDTIDFAVNDLMLGTSDPFFWFLVPFFAIVSVGICIAMNYVVLILTHIFSVVIARVRAWLPRASDVSKTSQATPVNQRIIATGVLVLLVVTIIPYQFAYMVLCIVQIATCIRALRCARETQSAPSYNFYNYTHSILVFMLWILPINMPVLVVWIHNLAVQWLTPFSTHHNLLSVLGYILLVEMMSTSNMIPRVTSRVRFVTNILMFAFALYAAVYGVTYAYRMHYAVNALCAWLFVVHLSGGPVSLASLSRYFGSSAVIVNGHNYVSAIQNEVSNVNTTPAPSTSKAMDFASSVSTLRRKPVIAIAGLGSENSTFTPSRTQAVAFQPKRGAEVIEQYEFLHDGTPLGDAADWRGTLTGHSLPGGMVTREAFEELAGEIIARLIETVKVTKLDGLWYDIHGAMHVEGLIDVEAELLRQIRKVIGPDVVVSASMDLHGNVSRELAHQTDLITCFRTAPHVDESETKERACRNLLQVLTGWPEEQLSDSKPLLPVKAWIPLPILLPGEQTSTRVEPAKHIYAAIAEVESDDCVLDAAIWVGYAWGDERRNRAVVMVTGWDEAIVARGAERLARLFWNAHQDFKFVAPTGTFKECLDAALASRNWPYYISDSGDNPTAGGSGDVTWTARRLLDRPEFNNARGPIVIYTSIPGPEAVRIAFQAGVGKVVTVTAGAAVDNIHEGPITMTGRVHALREGDPHAEQEAVLRVGSVYVILTKLRKPYHYEHDFVQLGLDPRKGARVVIVKIGYLEPELYDMAADWMMALTPGGVDQDLTQLDYHNIRRPMWPLDRDFKHEPTLKARILPLSHEPLAGLDD
ncbi:unnamed protein product [Zymoseptoria tritici ST99CH_3D1]|nr:unnamed protein product [Zymoseptoria tritici ST99CH_3D1]